MLAYFFNKFFEPNFKYSTYISYKILLYIQLKKVHSKISFYF